MFKYRSAPTLTSRFAAASPDVRPTFAAHCAHEKMPTKFSTSFCKEKKGRKLRVNESWKALTKDAAMQFTDTSKPHCSPSLVGSAVFVTKEGLKKRTRWAIFHQNLTDEDMHHGRTPDRAQYHKPHSLQRNAMRSCHWNGVQTCLPHQRSCEKSAVRSAQGDFALSEPPATSWPNSRILWSWSPMCPMCNALPKTAEFASKHCSSA